MTVLEKVLAKYIPEPNSGCWLWEARLDRHGYGTVDDGTKPKRAHKVLYESIYGPVTIDLDHKCRTRSCINPDHLEPVTRKINIRRGLVFKQHMVDGEWWMVCQRCKADAPVATDWYMYGGYPWRHKPCHRARMSERRRIGRSRGN